MATPIFLTGFEHGVLSTSGGGICDIIAGTPSVQSTVKRSGTYALRVNPTAGADYIYKAVPVSQTYFVGRLYIRFATLPDNVLSIVSIRNNAGEYFEFKVHDTGSLRAAISGNGEQTGPTLSTGTWYRLDFRMYCGSTTGTIDWAVDGDAQTQVSYTISASTWLSFYLGDIYNTRTYDAFFDDVIFSVTSGDYPIGEGEVIGLSPNAEGTHDNGGATMADHNGNVIDGSTYTAYDKLDEVPLDSEADYVKQAQPPDDTDYVEVQFTDLPAASQVNGAMGILAYSAETGAANEGACIARDSEATETEIYGTPASPQDYSETTLFYKSAGLPAPSGGWDQSEVNALRMRMGFSGDANPEPYWQAVMFEVDYVPGEEGVTLVVADATHAHAADAPVLTQAHTLAINAATHDHLADNIVLTQAHVLAIAEALHAHSADGIVLTQAHVLAIQEALHSHSSDPIALFQAHQLAMDDALHGHLADNIVLDVGAVVLIVADALHGHSAESPVLTQAHVLAIAEALHAHAADGINLVQAYTLIVAASNHAHTSDNITLSQVHNLLVESGLHAHASDPIVLSQVHSLLVNGATHAHTADNISLIYGDKYPILFQVEPRNRIFNVKPRKRLFRVEPRDREIDEKRRGN